MIRFPKGSANVVVMLLTALLSITNHGTFPSQELQKEHNFRVISRPNPITLESLPRSFKFRNTGLLDGLGEHSFVGTCFAVDALYDLKQQGVDSSTGIPARSI